MLSKTYTRILVLLGVSLLVMACGRVTTVTPTVPHDASHSMPMDSDAPYDLRFLDGMIMHHKGAITMAQDALVNAEHRELKEFAQNIIMQQDGEITQMSVWRAKWYPDAGETAGLDMHMGDMQISQDKNIYYDYRWIDAMISHHEGAIAMANDALANSKNTDIINLAKAIIQTQGEEINTLKTWRAQW